MINTKNKTQHWKPNISIDNLLKRASIIQKIRKFFNNLKFLEVETPSISENTTTDIYINPFKTKFIGPGIFQGKILYLINSPEYYMKRLLTFGSGPIFQICHSFRNNELGRYHNPEFTILEWYNLHSDIFLSINEISDLLKYILDCSKIEIQSYRNIFIQYTGIDPFLSDKKKLFKILEEYIFDKKIKIFYEDYDTLLQSLFDNFIVTNIHLNNPMIIYHFPSTQALLAKINDKDNRIANRFEVYFNGIELANGSCELTNAKEQHQRFLKENIKRVNMNLSEYSIDKNFLAALEYGMPACSGVALGIDRLLMIALHAKKISEVLSFPFKY